MNISRRSFMAVSLGGAAGVVLPVSGASSSRAPVSAGRVKLGISSYSYWHFRTARVPIETVIDHAAALGVEGVDILHRQMDIPELEPFTPAHRAYLQRLKRRAFVNGIDLICVSTHQNFVKPEAAARLQQVEHTRKCIH